MLKIKEIISNEKRQYIIYLVLSLGIVGFTGILYLSNPLSFQLYIGNINPLLMIPFVILLGFVLLTYLLSRGWFSIYKRGNLRRFFFTSSLAANLALVIILLDSARLVVFPADINVLFPQSLLFYPTIGYIVEIVFHILPLSLLLFFLTSLSKNISYGKIIWPCLLVVSLLEPIFQTVFGLSEQYPFWTILYTLIHVFLINFSQLAIFKRYDFTTMYSFRLVYYLLWHIVWGYLRLTLLF